MRVIYESILERLKTLVYDSSLRWVDLDRGQLKQRQDDRYPVAFPCALVRMEIGSTTDVTDTIQDCKATVTVTLAFDPQSYGRTAFNAPDDVRSQGLESYDIIAEVYRLLQGFDTPHFDSLVRRSQSEVNHNELFVYQLVFDCRFEDLTAECELKTKN
jgi:hypothetical protein